MKCLWKKLTKPASIYLSKYSELYIVKYFLLEYILKCNLSLWHKLNFQQWLLFSSVSLDPSKILIYGFAVQEASLFTVYCLFNVTFDQYHAFLLYLL